MKVNLLFFIIFVSIGLILMILSLIFRNKDKKMFKQCNYTIKGKVIKYTLWNNNGVHFPIVEYIVNDVKYNQRLKYGWIINKSSFFNKVKSEMENDVENDNLVIRSNTHISTNVLEDYFPVGTEVDVYYNPQNPKKSYVMRLIKNPAIKVFLITGLLFVILSFAGLFLLPNSVNNVKEDLYTIVIPKSFFEYSGSNAKEAVTNYINLGKEFCTSAIEKDNDLSVKITEEQRKNMIKRNNNFIEEIINDFENSNTDYDVIQSDDYKTLIIYADENVKEILFAKVILEVSSSYMLNNILENDNQDWSVYLKIINCHTGNIVVEGNVPQDTLSFGEEEWKASY